MQLVFEQGHLQKTISIANKFTYQLMNYFIYLAQMPMIWDTIYFTVSYRKYSGISRFDACCQRRKALKVAKY